MIVLLCSNGAVALQHPSNAELGRLGFPRSTADASSGAMSYSGSMELDATDWKILRELQRHGRLTNVDLAARVGLSPPPCLRRVQALERAGVIAGYRALLNAAALGFDVTLFAFVGLKSQAEAELRAFTDRVAAWPLVREAYAISGEADFLLKCVARDLPSLQDFIIRELSGAPNVENVKTTLMLRVAKYEPGVPIP